MINNLKEINDAQQIITQILNLIDEAESHFKSARTWGFFDMFGGGLITDMIKHSKLDSASKIMNQINSLLKDLQRELKEVVIPTDFSMNTLTLSSFMDIVFDGFLSDTYMQSKIMSSLSQVKELKNTLYKLQDRLNNLSDYYEK